MGYLPWDAPGTVALMDRAADRLFRSIQQNPAHVLFQLLPPTVQHRYGLRPRPHNYVRPPKDDTNFIARHLYKLHVTSKALYQGTLLTLPNLTIVALVILCNLCNVVLLNLMFNVCCSYATTRKATVVPCSCIQ